VIELNSYEFNEKISREIQNRMDSLVVKNDI